MQLTSISAGESHIFSLSWPLMLVEPPVLMKATFLPTQSYKDPRSSRESAEGQLLFAPAARDSWDRQFCQPRAVRLKLGWWKNVQLK